jgi:hypothetical protein
MKQRRKCKNCGELHSHKTFCGVDCKNKHYNKVFISKNMKKKCKYCGETIKVTQLHMLKNRKFCNSYCSSKYKKGRSMVDKITKKCKYCGENIEGIPSLVKNLKFCGRKCFFKYNSKRRTMLTLQKIKEEKKICKYCGETFNRKIGYGYDIWNAMKFCGRKCSGLWFRGRNHKDYKKIQLHKCKECLSVIPLDNNVQYYKYQKFCNKKCYSIWKKKKTIYEHSKIKLKKCLYCKKIIPYRSMYAIAKYCNRDCCHNHFKRPYEERFDEKTIKYMKKINSISTSKRLLGKSYDDIYGKNKAKELRKHISLRQLGSKGNNWRGGTSFDPYDISFNKYFKRQIAERDNHICTLCGEKVSIGHVHHIHYIKNDTKPEKVVLLCKSCHSRTNSNHDFWFAFFCELKQMLPEELLV